MWRPKLCLRRTGATENYIKFPDPRAVTIFGQSAHGTKKKCVHCVCVGVVGGRGGVGVNR